LNSLFRRPPSLQEAVARPRNYALRDLPRFIYFAERLLPVFFLCYNSVGDKRSKTWGSVIMRKTKIICTLGPAVNSEGAILQLIEAGMDAARFNFSHGTHESHLAQLDLLRAARKSSGKPVATILDTKGPEIRIRTFQNGPINLGEGDSFVLTSEDVPGDQNRVSVTYRDLPKELYPGCHILIDDGLIDLIAERITPPEIFCTVSVGGQLSNNKSINIPDVPIRLPSLTSKDEEDLQFAVKEDFDFIAASFVRRASDVFDIRKVLRQYGGEKIRIIAKIENREGVDNLPEIIDAADGVMVARGDLGVEIPASEVPLLQKKIISQTVLRGKPVITATQMLDSMIRNPRPTRAEASDVANAVLDGTSCVMLSGETASGKYPIQAVRTMSDIVCAAESACNNWNAFKKSSAASGASISDAISHACCLTAADLHAHAILAATTSGHTARMISRFRPPCPIIAITDDAQVQRQLSLSWGVRPCLGVRVKSTDQLFDLCVQQAQDIGVVTSGDTVVITAGVPIGKSGTTNLIKAQVV